MKHPVVNISGKKIGQIDLPDQLFKTQINETILALYNRIFLSRARQATRRTLRKAGITGTTAKVWRQKGTGRARHGSRKAPIFVGGAKAHGPTGQENFKLKLPKKVRKIALSSALSAKLDSIQIIKELDKSFNSAKIASKTLSNIKSITPGKKTLIILENSSSPIINSTRNISEVITTQASRINPHEIISSHHILITKPAVDVIIKTFTTKLSSKTTNKQSTLTPKTT